MKSNEKKTILILIVVSVIIIGVTWHFTRGKNSDGGETGGNPTAGQVGNAANNASKGEYTRVEKDGTVVNTSEKLKTEREDSGFLISNISFEEKNGETILKATLMNKTESVQATFLGDIVLMDKSGNEIGRIPVRVSEMQAGEIRDIEATITESYANAYDFKLEK